MALGKHELCVHSIRAVKKDWLPAKIAAYLIIFGRLCSSQFTVNIWTKIENFEKFKKEYV